MKYKLDSYDILATITLEEEGTQNNFQLKGSVKGTYKGHDFSSDIVIDEEDGVSIIDWMGDSNLDEDLRAAIDETWRDALCDNAERDGSLERFEEIYINV